MLTAAKNAVERYNADSLAHWNKIVGDMFGSTKVLASTRDFSGYLDRGVVNDIKSSGRLSAGEALHGGPRVA